MMMIMLLLLCLAHSWKAKGGYEGLKIDVVTAEAARGKHPACPRREGKTDYGG